MSKQKWSCVSCGDCCEPVLFNKEQMAQLSKLYPDLKWVAESGKTGILYHTQKSLTLGKCEFLKSSGGGTGCKKMCAIYEVRPNICRAYGDHEHIFLTCNKHPRFDIRKFANEEILLTMDDVAAWARYNKSMKTIF